MLTAPPVTRAEGPAAHLKDFPVGPVQGCEFRSRHFSSKPRLPGVHPGGPRFPPPPLLTLCFDKGPEWTFNLDT